MGDIPRIDNEAATAPNAVLSEGFAGVSRDSFSLHNETGRLPSSPASIVRSRPANSTAVPSIPIHHNAPTQNTITMPPHPIQTAPRNAAYIIPPLDFNKLPLVAGEDVHSLLAFAPKPALRPAPDIKQCLRNLWHDPFMGAHCFSGRGERSKPFPWLGGPPFAEPPAWMNYRDVTERNKDREALVDVSAITGNDGPGNRGAKSKGRTLDYTMLPDLPSFQIWSHPRGKAGTGPFNANIDPFEELVDLRAMRTSAIYHYVKDNLPDLFKSYPLDPQTAQPGPDIDTMKLATLVSNHESVRREIKNEANELGHHLRRYFTSWDLILRLRREICDLEAEQVLLMKQDHEMALRPDLYSDPETRRRLNQRRQMENCRDIDDRVRRLSNCEEGTVSVMGKLYECKTRLWPRLSEVLEAYDKWAEAMEMGLTRSRFVWYGRRDRDDREHNLGTNEMQQQFGGGSQGLPDPFMTIHRGRLGELHPI